MYEIIWHAILLISGSVLCIQDWRTYSVGLVPLLIFSIASFRQYWVCREYSLLLFCILILLGSIFKLLTKKSILGLADYLVSIIISPFLCNQDVPILLILIGMYGIFATILTKSIRKNPIIPFVPVLLISILTLRLSKGF